MYVQWILLIGFSCSLMHSNRAKVLRAKILFDGSTFNQKNWDLRYNVLLIFVPVDCVFNQTLCYRWCLISHIVYILAFSTLDVVCVFRLLFCEYHTSFTKMQFNTLSLFMYGIFVACLFIEMMNDWVCCCSVLWWWKYLYVWNALGQCWINFKRVEPASSNVSIIKYFSVSIIHTYLYVWA